MEAQSSFGERESEKDVWNVRCVCDYKMMVWKCDWMQYIGHSLTACSTRDACFWTSTQLHILHVKLFCDEKNSDTFFLIVSMIKAVHSLPLWCSKLLSNKHIKQISCVWFLLPKKEILWKLEFTLTENQFQETFYLHHASIYAYKLICYHVKLCNPVPCIVL